MPSKGRVRAMDGSAWRGKEWHKTSTFVEKSMESTVQNDTFLKHFMVI
jgi:hypothetical protein